MRIPSLVSARWLAKNLLNLKNKPRKPICVVDATWRLEDGTEQARQDYLDNHIPGAVYFDIDECCDKTNEFPHMLPNEKLFSEYVQFLGITNKCSIIAYDNNQDFGVFSPPRLWWTFRCFGHNTVSILNGGLSKWLDAGFPVNNGEEYLTDANEPFKAKLNPDLVCDYETMLSNAESGGKMCPVVDARGRPRFKGHHTEPRPGLQSGHIPYSINMPFVECLDENKEFLKEPEQLKDVFEANGVDLKKPFTTSCGSGITACLLVFAAHLCGQDRVAVYDGSWAEWGKRAPPNMVIKDPQ